MDNYNKFWNLTHQDVSLEDLRMDAQMIWLLCSLLSTLCWIIYITFYNSRLFALILTKVINKWLLTNAFFKVGSLTINVLAGKVMFRDIVFVCFDYSIRIQDGYVIFRWWRSYVPKDVSEDLSHSDTRLSITMNGFEVHVYNRSEIYNDLERIFGLSQSILLPSEDMSMEEINTLERHIKKFKYHRSTERKVHKSSVSIMAITWRDLIPVIKLDICCGRFVAGNRLTSTTLSISVEEARCIYSTKPAACNLDPFMHFVKAKFENAKVLFAPSLKYTGLADEPPRYMGEGFVVMMSNLLEVYFYMDEPGVVPEEPVHLTLANGDVVDPAPPVWGVDIKCGKGTDFSYGPWADRQRDQLFRFFFPPDWQEMKITRNATSGELRQYQSFDISLCTLNEATIDVLFSKEKETNAMHVTIGAGSYIEVTIPWTVHNAGYHATVYGQLLHMEATTSLQYRSLAECESFEYKISISYPKRWNEQQFWSINLTGYKATAYIIYKHKLFFQDLIEDWSSKSRSDLLTFIPYVCKLNAILKEFEIITMSNEFNWIDCSSANQENHHLAFCGDLIDLSCILPFNDFLPKTVKLKFWIHGEGLDLSMFLPEVSTSRPLVLALKKYSKILTRSGNISHLEKLQTKKWRRICLQSAGWIDCWSVPIIVISVQYIYHPIPPLGPDPQADITTPEKEEILLSPMRIPKLSKSPGTDLKRIDPGQLENDQITVELEVGSSVLMAYGSVLRQFINLKENIFGVDQLFQDMDQSNVKVDPQINLKDFALLKDQISKDIKNRSSPESAPSNNKSKSMDPRNFRPLEVIVSVTLHDVQAHLLKSCEENNVHCPTIFIERFGFEMKKNVIETQLQVLLSPSYILTKDAVLRKCKDKHLNRGHILISAIQIRGHAMFSNEGRSLDEDSLEYAWLLDTQIGKVSAKISLPQLCDLVIALESFIFLVIDPENRMKSPKTFRSCYHGVSFLNCLHTRPEIKYHCPSIEDIKYKMTRMSVDVFDIYLVESGIASHFWASPVRVGGCNLHGKSIKSGISVLVSNISIRILESITLSHAKENGDVNNRGKNTRAHCIDCNHNPPIKKCKIKMHENKKDVEKNGHKTQNFKCRRTPSKSKLIGQKDKNTFDNWLQVSCVTFGPLFVETALAFYTSCSILASAQQSFLRRHDFKSKRLWFVWKTDSSNLSRCGCTGGCDFFGNDGKASTFFKPNSKDISDSLKIIQYQVIPGKSEYGFGESILHENQLVFHTPPYNLKTVLFCGADDFDIQFRRKLEYCQKFDKKGNTNKWSNSADGSKNNLSRSYQRKEPSVLSDEHSISNALYIERKSSIEFPYLRLKDTSSLSFRNKVLPTEYSPTNLNNLPKSSTSDSKLLLTAVESMDEHYPQFTTQLVQPVFSINHQTKVAQAVSAHADSKLHNNVQRTISLTSDNQSEVFFSAEEDTTNPFEYSNSKMNTSCSVDKKKFFSDQSISVSRGNKTRSPLFKSDLELCNSGAESLSKRPQSNLEINADTQLFCGLATPLRKQKSIGPPIHNNVNRQSSSESLSTSSSSFISAISSQEDVSQVIYFSRNDAKDSSRFRAGYGNLLPLMTCYNWNDCSFPSAAHTFSFPLFEEDSNGCLSYIGNKMVPRFDTLSGSGSLQIIPKEERRESSGSSFGNLSSDCSREASESTKKGEFHSWDPSDERILQADQKNWKSFVIKMKGHADILVTPLIIEALQRMVESILPTVSRMNVSTIIHVMHSFCAYKVVNDNVLKREASLNYGSQIKLESEKSITAKALQHPGSSFLGEMHEEIISNKIQGLLILPKINIIILQSSKIKENLSCMTLVALQVEDLLIKYHHKTATKASICNVYTHPVIQTNESHKKGGIMRGTKALLAHWASHPQSDNVLGEPILIETSEKQMEELVVTLDLEKAQVQMLRLNNDPLSVESCDTDVTAIPAYRSKCIFDCVHTSEESLTSGWSTIMFECGLDGVSASLIQRSNFRRIEQNLDNFVEFDNKKLPSNINIPQTPISTNDGLLPKAESAWRLLSKRPPTPKMFKDKVEPSTDNIIMDKDLLLKDTKTKPGVKYNLGLADRHRLTNEAKEDIDGTSFIVDLKSVWVNFAAPSSVSGTKDNHFIRLDWNFLSTASPTITAWMNPSNVLAIKIVALARSIYAKNTAAAACLIADSYQNGQQQRKIQIKKRRYPSCHTILSKTLQEDPSCQLCIIMQLNLLKEETVNYEEILSKTDVPHLNILREGIIILCRQWKNTLYNPLLFEHQYGGKLKGPINYNCTYQQTHYKYELDSDKDSEELYGSPVDSNEDSENTVLLGQGSFIPEVSNNRDRLNANQISSAPSVLLELKNSTISNTPNLNFTNPDVSEDSAEGKGDKKFSSKLEKPGYSTLQQDSNGINKEDLYISMAQLENSARIPGVKHQTESSHHGYHRYLHEGFQDSIKLLDAHLIFEPLLTYLGVMPQQIINELSTSDISTLENLGTNVSLLGSVNLIRVDIVVSEAGQKKQQRGRRKIEDISNEQPAFLCQSVAIELGISKKYEKVASDMKPNIDNISHRPLKKQTSRHINYNLNVDFISQQINMPLLRLIRQISTMYYNFQKVHSNLEDYSEQRKNPHQTKGEESSDAASGPIKTENFTPHHLFQTQYNIIEKKNSELPLYIRSKTYSTAAFTPMNPYPVIKSRPQTFAQKLKSTGKSVKGKLGYINLNDASPGKDSTSTTLVSNNLLASIDSRQSVFAASQNTWEGNIEHIKAKLKSATPTYWNTFFQLLELYGTVREHRSFNRFSVITEEGENAKVPRKNSATYSTLLLKNNYPVGGMQFVIFGIATIQKTQLLAMLSGLKLESEITNLNTSLSWTEKMRPPVLEYSLTGKVGRTMTVLVEGVAPNQQTVANITIGKSNALFSCFVQKNKDRNSGLVSIGPITAEIPQHPVALHGMMTRSSKKLSYTLQELGVGRTAPRSMVVSDETASPATTNEGQDSNQQFFMKMNYCHSHKKVFMQPIVINFNILLKSLSINAALLPSLQAQYKMTNVSSAGITGNKTKFTVDLPSQSLSFTTKILNAEVNLPPEASLALPNVHIYAEFIPESGREDIEIDGIILQRGGYVSALAEIGAFERCLTTDLLNHLVFVQKVFMKEINEVLQKIYGSEKPVPLWLDYSDPNCAHASFLLSIDIHVKRIQLTATTPCSSAVRFETGTLELHFSNRVKNIGKNATRKWFGKAHIDLNLSLGQIIKNIIFDEAEPEFQQYAFFNTTVQLRNAFQDEVLNDNKELILLMLKRPLIYIQPIAVDKAILIWLNYKNAYEYWAEKRANLSYDSYEKNKQVFDKVPFGQFGNIATSNLSALFLQLSVEDMGICLPLKQIIWAPRSCHEFEPRNAVVITLESTIISACNSGSLVSKGKFQELCLRFADDFETTLDDWKPNAFETNIMNLCVVSEGTYEVCSHTVATKRNDNAKWFLNVKWQMEGVDIHLDINIGKQLSSLGHTLTMLTGFDEEEDNDFESPKSYDGDQVFIADKIKKHELENLPSFIFDTSLNSHMRAFLMEKEMAEQLRIINDLRTLGASYNTIIHEERRLQELQALCYKYFRRDMIQKWKKASIRRNMLKTKNRSQSFIASSGKYENQNAVLGRLSTDDSSAGPSRSASVRYGYSYANRVLCSEAKRQASLPSEETHMEFEGTDPHLTQNESENLIQEGSSMLSKSAALKQQEPNIDFELNIKVLINSGKCALHTKGINDDKFVVHPGNVNHRKDRSIGNDWSSPTPSRRTREKSKIRHNTINNAFFNLTIFHIPGLDVKLFYESTTLGEDAIKNTQAQRLDTIDLASIKKCVIKKGSLFAWIILQSIPEETIISPHILEFLEQTLEPIPLKNDNTFPMNHVNIELLSANYATYSSFPVDVIVYFHMQPSTFRFSCLPVSRVECMLQLPSLDIVFSSKRATDCDLENLRGLPSNPNTGGLSVTGCLADFNLYIFHPYGGKKSGLKEAHFSPLTSNERKDSLSVSVEFIKFHLTRCRKLHVAPSKFKQMDNMPMAVIRFSTVADIGSASFKYDMRRLTEILAFPKAWYRKTIVRRLFLGDMSLNRNLQEECMQSTTREINKAVQFDSEEGAFAPLTIDSKISRVVTKQEWDTLVLFAVNFTKLNVQMNMGNVMGNVLWLTRDFRSDGKLSIGSHNNKNMHVGVHLGGSSLDAKGGIVGGIFDINDIGTQFHVKEESGREPYHTIQSKLKAMETRLDYMGTSILMGRISSFSMAVRDEWKTRSDECFFDLKQSAIIFIHGDLLWNQLQIMISKSTTADILKIYYKLEEFFLQQFKSSKRVFINLESKICDRNQSAKRKQLQAVKHSEKLPVFNECNDDARHHRHWQKPLNQAITSLLSHSKSMPPSREYILGGTFVLHGKNISLACFNGINFKSKSWALFSLKEPFINFATEAQYVGTDNETQIVETLAFSLGQNEQNPQTHSMAIVSRVTRNIVFPPQYKTLTEWFHYAFAHSDIDEIDRFPTIDRNKDIVTNSMDRSRGLSVVNSSSKAFNLNHNREIIFALPSLQLHFKTEHKQALRVPNMKGSKPIVVCSFITEFEDHIFVTVDADAFFFLHDLITSYVKEKERVIGAQSARTSSPNWSDLQKNVGGCNSNIDNAMAHDIQVTESKQTSSEAQTDIEHYIRDWRHFECKAWHLEPTVRLLSWAGKSIEPYGVDYILNKLGFSHARITIPKWLQRGFMDPLDKIQALMMMQLLNLAKENRTGL